MKIPKVVTIAGSDPSGGAGIQADLKTFSALGAYGMSVLTGLTAQNTRRVTGIHPIPAAFVVEQIRALREDIEIDAIKTGMLGRSEIVSAVARALESIDAPIVVDPVMVAKSGDHLLERSAVLALKEELLPLATLITPNLPEVGVLLGTEPPYDRDTMELAARALLRLGPKAVLLKGGHLSGARASDLFFDGTALEWLDAPMIETRHTHGTGCTLSAAITALIPCHARLLDAVRAAKEYLSDAIARASELDVGGGHGPVHHFYRWWD